MSSRLGKTPFILSNCCKAARQVPRCTTTNTKQAPPDYRRDPLHSFIRHQAGRFLWAFAHCSVWIVGGGPGLYSGPWLRIRRSPAYNPVGFLPFGNLPVSRLRLPGFQPGLARHPWRQHTRSPPDRSRLERRIRAIAYWAPKEQLRQPQSFLSATKACA